jgi:hypothetical protein
MFEDACRFAVGLAAGAAGVGGGGGGACGAGFLQAALRARIATKVLNTILACVGFRILFLFFLLVTIYVSSGAGCNCELSLPDIL